MQIFVSFQRNGNEYWYKSSALNYKTGTWERGEQNLCSHVFVCVCFFFFLFCIHSFLFFYSAYMCLLAAAVCLRSCNIDTSLSYFAARQFIRLSFGKRICFVRILLFEFYWIMPSYVLMSVSLVDDSRSSKCRLFVEDLYYILLFMGVAVVVAI